MPSTLPALQFEPDGYVLTGPALMGRHSAGHAFLRAAVQASEGGPLVACTPRDTSAQVFTDLVKSIDPKARPQWVPPDHFDALASLGGLYVPGPGLAAPARMRLRAGPAAYSLSGVTHTLSTHAAMDAIKEWLWAPVMPWDAMVCTSSAALHIVQQVLAQEADYLRWRLGPQVQITQPQLPVIPLGVHAQDFTFSPAQHQAARQALGLAPGDVAVLFAGRLSFNSKAHPHAMFAALQATAQRSSHKLVLVQCGWFPNEATEQAIKQGTAAHCADVRSVFVDGRDDAQRQHAWAAADVFISLSDNIQETFGLTPIEAMAAGLPVVVTDWNGYKDTVRDGVDGFRIPTRMPEASTPEAWSARYEAGALTHDAFCGLVSQTVSVDMQLLTERLHSLIEQPALRQHMGNAGRQRVADAFEWRVVFAQYQALWADLARQRQAEQDTLSSEVSLAPRFDAARPSPYAAFAHYPSHSVGPDAVLHWQPGHTVDGVMQLLASPLFAHTLPTAPEQQARMAAAFAVVQTQPTAVADWAQACRAPTADMLMMACQLLKIGAVRVGG